MTELFARYGDTYRVFSPTRKAYILRRLTTPTTSKRVLVSNHRNYTKGIGLDRVKILLGKGLMTSEGDLWKRQRYMMQPFFHRGSSPNSPRCWTRHQRPLSRAGRSIAARGEPVNITDEMSELTLDIVLRSIFGRDLDRMSGNSAAIPSRWSPRTPRATCNLPSNSAPSPSLSPESSSGGAPPTRRHFDFVGMLMSARDKETGEPMSDRELIDEIMTLVVAGHETTASGLNWTWYLISQNPQVEARLHAEIDAAPEMTGPSLAQMESLPYTRQVIDEALRLYPPGWLLSRRTIEPDALGGYEISGRSECPATPVSPTPGSTLLERP